MKRSARLLFDAIQKNDFRVLTNDWVYVLSNLFHRAVLNYEDFLLFKDFYDHFGEISFDISKFKVDIFDKRQDTFFYGTEIRMLSEQKIRSLLPDVYNFLSSSYSTFGIFANDVVSLQNRLNNKKIIDFKWWLGAYFSPNRPIDEINTKRKLSLNDLELIAKLNLGEYSTNIYKNYISKNSSKDKKNLALRSLLLLKDKKADFYLKKVTLDPNTDSETRNLIVKNLLLRKITDITYWDTLIRFEIDSELIEFINLTMTIIERGYRNQIELVILNRLESKDTDYLNITLHILNNFFVAKDNSTIFPIIFNIFFYDNSIEHTDVFSEKMTKEFVVSNICFEILVNLCNGNSKLKKEYENLFIKQMKNVDKIKEEIFRNFIDFLLKITNKSEFEDILTKTLKKFRVTSSKINFLDKIEKFLSSFAINYNTKTGKIWLANK